MDTYNIAIKNIIRIFKIVYLTGTIIAQIPTGSSRVKTNEFPSEKTSFRISKLYYIATFYFLVNQLFKNIAPILKNAVTIFYRMFKF